MEVQTVGFGREHYGGDDGREVYEAVSDKWREKDVQKLTLISGLDFDSKTMAFYGDAFSYNP